MIVGHTEELIRQYPKVPLFYNYKFGFLTKLKREKEAFKLSEEIYDKFPNYLFAKCDYLTRQWEKGKQVKIEEVFGQAKSISDLYPERKEFHTSELFKFNHTMAIYHLDRQEVHHAYAYYKDLIIQQSYFHNIDDFLTQILPVCVGESQRLILDCRKDKELMKNVIQSIVNVKQ